MNYQQAFISDLTLDYIIDTLKKSGINSKKIIIDKLTNATEFDLLTLKRSIQDKITSKRMEIDD